MNNTKDISQNVWEVVKLFKLNFEKTAIFVLILILCISTANIYSQFISTFIDRRDKNEIHTSITPNFSFPGMLLKVDQLYKESMYKEAQNEYLKLTSKPDLSPQQKATVYFKLGVCNYKLEEYDKARDSFLKAAEYNSNDPVAYNNAAVCSFYLNEMGKAEELQKRAIATLQVVEYYYNLARIYEASGRYIDAAKYYTAVVRGEENITIDDSIDPVRIKNKLMKLLSDLSNAEEFSKDLMIALRLKDTREVFVIADTDMDIKDKNFQWRIQNENGINKLYCSYDREKSDPYNLIDSLQWTVSSGGRAVFTGKKDDFSLSLGAGDNYIVYLDIDYDSNRQARSYVDVTRNNGMYSNPTTNPSNAKCKYYEFAAYEQVFEKNFKISSNGYVDRFNAKWGKDNIETKVMDKDFIDAQSALYIKNTTGKNAGIWADLSSLLNDKQLKGRTIGIKFYARKISSNADLDVSIRTKTGKVYNKNTPREYELDYKWKRFGVDVLIPENADGLTISFRTNPGEEIKIDGFIISIVR
ncbi:MAG TPA: tetratricopeptide repeat protein [Clostridia bacterium]|nr:tetratricopeptide repeat protein [Clostridia bacterium]